MRWLAVWLLLEALVTGCIARQNPRAIASPSSDREDSGADASLPEQTRKGDAALPTATSDGGMDGGSPFAAPAEPSDASTEGAVDGGFAPTTTDGGADPFEAFDAAAGENMSGEPTQAPREILPGIVPEPHDNASYIYDPDQLRTYELTVAEADLAQIDADPTAEAYVPASLRFEGSTYDDVGMRYKGSVGAFLPPCTDASYGTIGRVPSPRTGKCSIKVSFNKYDPEGRFYGLKKLQFHSMNRDKSMMRDRLAYAMFRQSGLAAPRSVHARLFINGELAGLFALVEQIDGRFTRSRFSEGGKGNLYKEIWPLHDDLETYLNALETNEDEDPVVDAFVAFKQAVPEGPEALAQFIDWDTILTLLAVDRVILNDDGPLHFWCASGGQGNNPGGEGNHNYYWYETGAGGHFTLIPWDMDSSFAGSELVLISPAWYEPAETCVCRGTLVPPSCDPLVQQFIALRERIEAHIDDFLAGPFAADNVESLLATWEAQIADAVAESAGIESAPSTDEWQQALARLRNVIEAVRESRGYPYETGLW